MSTAKGLNLTEEIQQAARRIGPHVLETALFHSAYLDELSHGEVYLKLESEQYTGSFKARGALNKVLSLPPEQKANGLLTASSGNHAQGFARALAAEKGMVWVSPYNDPMVIAGQGTVGKEILDRLPYVDVVLATVGGGGLVSGIAAWIKEHRPEAEIIGCLPEKSPEMYLSVMQGEIVMPGEPQATLSDGSAGGCEPGAVTFDLCCELVDDYILVSEEEIADAIRWMADKHHKIIEGAAGVALGAFMKQASRFEGKKTAVVICGANITTETLKRLLDRG